MLVGGTLQVLRPMADPRVSAAVARSSADGLDEVVIPPPWKAIVKEHSHVFSEPGQPRERSIKHRIDLLNESKSIPHHRQYRMSADELSEVKRQIDELLSKGWIRPSTSQYNHPILFARKKGGGLRMCVDFRSLNANTVLDKYPLPRIDDILDRLHGSKIFSKIDLHSGYH